MNYKEFNDYGLLDQIHSCGEDANEILLYKYSPLIVSLATKMIKYSAGGLDLNDLIQEGLLGLNEAINTYRDDKNANFGTYAKLCIQNRLISVIKSTKTNKNKILNESISIENEDENIGRFVIDNKNNPLTNLYEDEEISSLTDKLLQQLTDLEKEVFELKINDFNYREIADLLDKDPKSIDNAIQRIKTKLKNILKNN